MGALGTMRSNKRALFGYRPQRLSYGVGRAWLGHKSAYAGVAQLTSAGARCMASAALRNQQFNLRWVHELDNRAQSLFGTISAQRVAQRKDSARRTG